MGIYRLSDVVPEVVGRRTSTFEELDWGYGKKGQWGIPGGRISVWTGQQGVGKTRLLTQMMKAWDALGWSSVIAQGEVSPAQFAFEKMNGYKSSRILITDEMDIYDQIEAMRKYAPEFWITDSVQQVEQYRNGKGAKEIVREIRKVISRTGTHVIFISQMTVSGTTKGGTELPHEVDVELYLKRWAPETCPDIFSATVAKNRYGSSGKEVIFVHKNEGVECQGMNRFKDMDWVNEHPGSLPMSAQKRQRGMIGRFLWGNA